MTYPIAYGTDTGSIEDPLQLVVLYLPEECSGLESEELEDYINDHELDNYMPLQGLAGTPGTIPATELVPLRFVVESLELALDGEDIDKNKALRVIATLVDSIANNWYN